MADRAQVCPSKALSTGNSADSALLGQMLSTASLQVRAFGSAVRARREELGLSQEALGYKAKVHRTYVSDAQTKTIRIGWVLKKIFSPDIMRQSVCSRMIEH